MLGWPNHPIGGGRSLRLAWGGSATPRPAVWGRPNHPQWPRGWFSRHLGQTLKKKILGRLAQGAAKPPLGPITQKKKKLAVWPKGRPNHPLGRWGWFGRPQTSRPGGG